MKTPFSKMSKDKKGNLMIAGVVALGLLVLILSFTGGKLPTSSHREDAVTSSTAIKGESFSTTVELHEAELIRVVDGDTLLVNFNNMEMYLRLLGVDTPESVNPDETKNNEYGEIASRYTKDLLKDTEYVYLEFGTTTSDKYGRILAYVWLDDEIVTADINVMKEYMLNYILVDQGYAYDKPVAPNLKYCDSFKDACENAKLTNTGLWCYKGFNQLYEAR